MRGAVSRKAAMVLNDAGGNMDVTTTIRELEDEMITASNNLEFEKAALLRDQIRELKRGLGEEVPSAPRKVSYGKSKKRRTG